MADDTASNDTPRSDPGLALQELEDLHQRARKALAAGRLDLAEAVFAEQAYDSQALIEELRIREAELRLQNEDLSNSRLALEETAARFTAFFHALPVAALILESRGMIQDANPAAESLLDFRVDEHQRYFFTRFVEHTRRGELFHALRLPAVHAGIILREVGLLRPEGSGLIGDVHLAPLPGETGAETEFICSVIDRSESVQQRQRLEDSVASLQRENNARRAAERALSAQQTQLKGIFQAAPVGIVFARGRKMLQCNAAWSELIGYSSDELHGRDTRPLYRGDDEYERVGHELYAQIHAGGTGRLETQLRHKTGKLLDVVLCAAPIEPDGALESVVVTVLDVSERKAAERALQEREERLRLTLEATNDGLWDLDLPAGRVIANARFSTMLGYAPQELDLRFEPLFALVHPDDRSRMRARFDEHLSAGAPYALDFRMRCKDGGWRWLHTRGEVVARDAEGRPQRVVGTHTDIHALTESNRRLREAERLAALGHWEYDLDTAVWTWSAELYRIFGFDPDAPVPDADGLAEHFHPDDAGEFLAKSQRLRETGEADTFLLRIYGSDGALRWIFSEGRAERDSAGRVVRCFGTAQDVTEREQAQERLREAATVFETTAEAVIVADAGRRIIAVNPAFSRITGYRDSAVCGRALESVLTSIDDPATWKRLQRDFDDDGRWQGEHWEHREDGTLYRARLGITMVRDDRGEIDRYVIVMSDTTPLLRTQQQVDFLTHYDPLTGLVNRTRFRDELTWTLQDAEHTSTRLAVLLLDLDRFRVVNESLGPAGADRLLKLVASALSAVMRPGDTIARIGGDEFGVILPESGSNEAISDIADRLQRCCAERKVIDGQTLAVTASVGVAIFPDDGLSSDALLRHADVALKQGKARGRQSLQYFENTAARRPLDRLHLEACLSQALLGGELALNYQPQVRLSDGQLVGAEALLRWTSAELGPISPQQFIPVAEDMGLIHELGAWVLRQAADQLATWDRAGKRLPRVAVNLSILQLEDTDLVDTIDGSLRQHELDPGRLELELTESMIMRQAGQSIATLDALRRLGVRLVIDDFGTGYSSLAYLHRLPLHQLKIDRSFIDPLPADPQSQAITNAILALGASMDLEVLAEGVETAEQADWLRSAGCLLAQGYHYARPLPRAAFSEQWL